MTRTAATGTFLLEPSFIVLFKSLYSRLSLLVITRQSPPNVRLYEYAVVWYLTDYYGTSVTLGFLVWCLYFRRASLLPNRDGPNSESLVFHISPQGSYIVLSLQPSREHPVTKGKATRYRLRPSSHSHPVGPARFEPFLESI